MGRFRSLLILAPISMVILLVSLPVSDAGASTTFGSDLTGTPAHPCPVTSTTWCTATNISFASGSPTAPVGGVVTKFRLKHGAVTASGPFAAFNVLSGTSPNFTATATTGEVSFPPTLTAATDDYVPRDSNSDPKGLPIASGDRIGVYVDDTDPFGTHTSFIADRTGYSYGSVNFDHTPSFGQQTYTAHSDSEVLLQGVIEPDADSDGYGDDTQDNCPSVANTDQNSNPCPPQISIDDQTVAEGNSGTTNASFHVTLDHSYASNVTVHYKTTDGTAKAPGDYTAAADTTLTFTPGQTSKTVPVPVKGDTIDEPDETYTVDLSNPSNATIADSQGAGQITDDDSPPTLSVGDLNVNEGDSGTTNATFHVTLDAASGKTIQVTYQTEDGTAQAPGDYTATGPATLTFDPGDTDKTVDVPVVVNTTVQSDRSFKLNISSPTNATIADSQGVATIVDDDSPPTISVDNVAVTEGNSGTVNATFHVTLNHAPNSGTVTVNYATADNTALQPADYTAASGALSFGTGETSKTVDVAVKGDTVDEANETFFVNLTSPANATIADNQGIGTINDDDASPNLSIDNPTFAEGKTGTVSAVFHVTLDAPSGQTVQVTYQTADGTARVADGDYQAQGPATLTFLPGQTSKTVTVPVTADQVYEGGDETFYLALSNAVHAQLPTPAYGTATVTEDDSLLCKKPALRQSRASASAATAESSATATASRTGWKTFVLGNAHSYRYGDVQYDKQGRRYAAALGSGLWYFKPSGVAKKVDAIGANPSFGFDVTNSGTPRFGYGGPWSEDEPAGPGEIGVTHTCRVLKTASGPGFRRQIIEASHIGDLSAYGSVDLAIDPKGGAGHLAYSVGANEALYYRKLGAANPVRLAFAHVGADKVHIAAYGGTVAVAAADDDDLVLFTHKPGGSWVKKHVAGKIGPVFDLAMGPDRKPRIVFGRSGRDLNMYVYNGSKVVKTILQAYEMAVAVDGNNRMHVATGARFANYPFLRPNSIYYMKLTDAGRIRGLQLARGNEDVGHLSLALSPQQAAIASLGNFRGLLVSVHAP
jgi:hypothetical protein